MSEEIYVTRVVELRVRIELQTVDELEAALKEMRAQGMPGEAEVNIDRGGFGAHLVARYWPQG